jgi:anti-sigma28 factor (negative regulator of flagellin synthesis)
MSIDPQVPTPGSPEMGRAKDIQSVEATIRMLVLQLDQVPDIRQERVSALRSAIAFGKYNPDDGLVAVAILAQLISVSHNM